VVTTALRLKELVTGTIHNHPDELFFMLIFAAQSKMMYIVTCYDRIPRSNAQ
jgi:hypothetical protein